MVFASRSHSTCDPNISKKSTILFTSVMSGTLRTVIVSSVSNVAHSIGNTAFLLPDGVIEPDSDFPPRTSRLSLMTGPRLSRVDSPTKHRTCNRVGGGVRDRSLMVNFRPTDSPVGSERTLWHVWSISTW